MFDLPHNFGDYTLVAFIGRTRGGILYQAIQQGMDRSVFLELLDPDNPEGVGVEDFLMKARTRAAINAPVLGTVYEASQAQGYWFVTSEQLGGSSLQSMLDRGQTLSMKDLLKVIETVGNVCGRYERLRTAFNIMEPRHIFLDDKSAVRLMNTAVPGDFHEETSRDQMKRLGIDLPPLVTPDVPGTTRMRTLLEWMREGQNGKPMQWDQVMELVAAVREQLGLSPRVTTHRYTVPVESRGKAGKRLLWAGTGLLGAGIAVAAVLLLFPREKETVSRPHVPAPKHYPDFSASDHTEVRVTLPGGGELIVGAHEITLESYRLFLDQWARLTPELRENVPPGPAGQEDCLPYSPGLGGYVEGGFHAGRQMERQENNTPLSRRQRHFLGCLGVCELEARGPRRTALPPARARGVDGSGEYAGNG